MKIGVLGIVQPNTIFMTGQKPRIETHKIKMNYNIKYQ
jgi:hypothetical protein